MQLNLSTDYALRSLIFLNSKEQGVSSNDISKNIGIEREFTLKILRQLKQGGFVEASRGKAGGYRLARPLDEITLLEVLKHMEESIFINHSLEEGMLSDFKVSELHSPVQTFYVAFQTKMAEVLDRISIEDVVNKSYDL